MSIRLSQALGTSTEAVPMVVLQLTPDAQATLGVSSVCFINPAEATDPKEGAVKGEFMESSGEMIETTKQVTEKVITGESSVKIDEAAFIPEVKESSESALEAPALEKKAESAFNFVKTVSAQATFPDPSTCHTWDNPFIIPVSAIDDNDIEGAHTTVIIPTVISNESLYTFSSQKFAVPIIDNDKRSLVISSSTHQVSESGETDTFGISLPENPTDKVYVTIDPDGQLDVGPKQLCFKPTTETGGGCGKAGCGGVKEVKSAEEASISEEKSARATSILGIKKAEATKSESGEIDVCNDWNQPYLITVSAIDDTLVEGEHNGILTITTESSDGFYHEIEQKINVTIIDNDFNVTTGGSTGFLSTNPIPVTPPKIDTNNAVDLACPHFTHYVKYGKLNPISEVKKIQEFLNKEMNAHLLVSGIYTRATERAVKAFQLKERSEIMDPWGLEAPTGWWYQSSRNRANEIVGCDEGEMKLDNGVLIS